MAHQALDRRLLYPRYLAVHAARDALADRHLSQDHNEQDLGLISTIINLVAKVAGVFIVAYTGNPLLLLASFDLPIRAEYDAAHGGIREFGLDMTTPGEWKVVDPQPQPHLSDFPENSNDNHVHDFSSYGGDNRTDWVSPLTYYRLTQANP
jgi:hypothetical protein